MDTHRTRLGAAAIVVLLGGSTAAHATQPFAVPVATARTSTPTATTITGLARGAKPRIAYIRGKSLDFEAGDYTLLRPDGSTLGLPRGPWSEWAPMGRGAIGSFGTEAGPLVQQVDGTGHVTTTSSYHFGLAVSPDRGIVGWLVGRLNTPHVVEGGGSRSFDLPRIGHGLRIAAIAGSRTCQPQPPETGGCSVLVNTAGSRGYWTSAIPDFVGFSGRPRAISDLDQRNRALGLTSHGRWGLYNRSLEVRWTAGARTRLVGFAPNGKAVLGTGPLGRPFDDIHRISLYDDTGRLLASYAERGHDRIDRVVWEDATHVLAAVFELGSGGCPGACRGHWALVRLGLDGTAELATPVVKGVIDYAPYSLPLT